MNAINLSTICESKDAPSKKEEKVSSSPRKTTQRKAPPAFANEPEVEPNYLFLGECCHTFKGIHQIFEEILNKKLFMRKLYKSLHYLFVKEFDFLEEKCRAQKKTWGRADYSNLIHKNLFVFKENLGLVFPSILKDFFNNFSRFLDEFKFGRDPLETRRSRSSRDRAEGAPKSKVSHFRNRSNNFRIESNRNLSGVFPKNQDSGKKRKEQYNRSISEKNFISKEDKSERPMNIFCFEDENPKLSKGYLFDLQKDGKQVDQDSAKKKKKKITHPVKKKSVLKTFFKKASIKSSQMTKEHKKKLSKNKRHKKPKIKKKIQKKLKNFFNSKFKVSSNNDSKKEDNLALGLRESNVADSKKNEIGNREKELSAINFDIIKLNNDFRESSGSNKSSILPQLTEIHEERNTLRKHAAKDSRSSDSRNPGKLKFQKVHERVNSRAFRFKYSEGFCSLTKSLSKVAKQKRHRKKLSAIKSKNGVHPRKKASRNLNELKPARKNQATLHLAKTPTEKMSIHKVIENDDFLSMKVPNNLFKIKKERNKYNPFIKRSLMCFSENTKFLFDKKVGNTKRVT